MDAPRAPSPGFAQDTDLAFREHASVQMDTHRLTAPLRDALTDVAAKVNVFKEYATVLKVTQV